MGSLAEILRAFDMHLVFPEINALQTAVRHVAHEYLGVAEDYGYSPDVCGYVKADVAMQLQGGKHPMGRIPKPALALATNACNTYVKWAEFWERYYKIPMITLDIPGSRDAPRAARPRAPRRSSRTGAISRSSSVSSSPAANRSRAASSTSSAFGRCSGIRTAWRRRGSASSS